jgi:hypothetical protein
MKLAANTKNGKLPGIDLEVYGMKLGPKEAEIKRPYLDTIHLEMRVYLLN